MPLIDHRASQDLAKAFLHDWCEIRNRRSGPGVLDRAAMTVDIVDAELLYEGKCHISTLQSKRSAIGVDDTIEDEHLLRIPPCQTPIPVGSRVKLRDVNGLQHTEFEVIRVPPRTVQFLTHLIVERREPEQRVG